MAILITIDSNKTYTNNAKYDKKNITIDNNGIVYNDNEDNTIDNNGIIFDDDVRKSHWFW